MTLWDDILKKFQEKQEEIKNSLANGAASEYHEHRQMVGQITAIEWCTDTLKDVVNKRIYEEEE